jgi:hypothetical protein
MDEVIIIMKKLIIEEERNIKFKTRNCLYGNKIKKQITIIPKIKNGRTGLLRKDKNRKKEEKKIKIILKKYLDMRLIIITMKTEKRAKKAECWSTYGTPKGG